MQAERNRVPTLFVTGAPGSGKTALAKEVSELLWRVREPHAVIDVDELCRGVLPGGPSDFNRSLALENLAAVWKNFSAAGFRRLILARVIQSRDDLDLYAHAIPGCDLTVCRVAVEHSIVTTRLREREPGLAGVFLTTAASALDDVVVGLDLPGFVVENGDERSITDLAFEVLDRIDWPRPSRDLLD